METKRLAGLTALLVGLASLAGCQNAKQSQIVNITGPTSVTGGDNGGGGNPPPTPNPAPNPSGSAPGSFTLHGAACAPISDREYKATFTWTSSSGAANYRVERRAWSQGQWVPQGIHTGSSFEQVVEVNADFYYRVIAHNSVGETLGSPVELFVCGAKPSDNGGGGNPPPTNNPNPNPPPTDPPPPPPATPKPIVDFTATPSNINVGHASLLRWSVQHATSSCSKGGGWSGSASTLGSQSVSPASTTTYTLSCTGSGGTTTASVTVTVAAPPPGVKTITLTPTSGSGKAGTTQQLTAVCRIDGVPTSCNAWWSSSDPSRVGVGTTNGLVQYIFNGASDVCVQWSRTEVTPRACGTFTTVP